LHNSVDSYPANIVASDATRGNISRVVDGDLETVVDFPVQPNEVSTSYINLNSASFGSNHLIRTSQINLRLDRFVSLPNTISISYLDPVTGESVVALAESDMRRTNVTFPEIISNDILITLTYTQPLRISEIIVQDKNQVIERNQGLRFLAQPNTGYDIYYQSDISPRVPTIESGDLRSDEGVLVLGGQPVSVNRGYVPSDQDDDGVSDTVDNCIQIPNSDQVDINNNGLGDVCDDFDRDGVINSRDNCVNQPNRRQADVDGDGIGDACDEAESRFTEANPWVPWAGMGIAFVVIIVLFVLVLTRPQPGSKPE
jgi:hypothetical protein